VGTLKDGARPDRVVLFADGADVVTTTVLAILGVLLYVCLASGTHGLAVPADLLDVLSGSILVWELLCQLEQ